MITRINKPIVIFRGDDTSAFNLRTIKIILKGDLDLSNAIAKFTLLDYRKEWTVQEVASSELTMSFSSVDTKAMPLGEQTGTFRLYDMSTGEPRQLTVVNKIPFLVTNRVCELDDESYHADVSVASGEIISIEFNVGVGAVNGKADKVKNAVDGDLAGLDENGNLTDSGIPASDVLRKIQMDTTPTAGSLNPVTSDGIKQAIDDATPSDYEQVKSQVEQNTTDIGAIEGKIPSQASAQNQLADKDFVNSSIATNTATFRGTYNLVSDLGLTTSATHEQVAAAVATKLAALSITPENNDYCFVQVPKSDAEPTVIVRVDRYKCTVEDGVSSWDYEWSLNNSSFTADQWAAINSGITSALVTKLGALPTADELAVALLAKYEKPSGGIPKSDLSAGVQESLDKADTALQTAPVTSVNGKAGGAVTLTASDVGALPTTGGTMTGGLTVPRLTVGQFYQAIQTMEDFDGAYMTICGIWHFDNFAAGRITRGGGMNTESVAFLSDIPSVAGLAPLASPAFTGTPTAPTPTAGDNSTKVATTAFVQGKLPYAIASVPSGDALADRTVNTKTVNAATYAPSFPTETSGKSCDFYLAITSDTAGTVSAPSGKTLNNAKGESANLDYEANKTTVLRFTQIGANTYVVTGGANGGGSVDPAQLATKLDSEAAAPDYDSTATYAEGAYVTYLGKLYYAKQAITTAEAWTAAHWQEDRLAPYIKTFAAAITALSQRGYVIDDNGQPVAVFPDGTVPQIDGYPLRYSIPASVALTATDDEATLVLADRAVTNATIATGFSTLNLTFPTAISGKVRDFYMRITVAAGESAPAMVLPQGITAETPDGSLPAIADGDASAASTTIVYFSETSAGTFTVKAETVTTVASAA